MRKSLNKGQKVQTRKILFFDIETAPNIGYIWGKYEQNVIKFIEEGYMLCFAYKWAHQKQTKVISLPDFDLYKKDMRNDTELVKKLWDLFDEADIIIGHNGDRFDIKMTNKYFTKAKLNPPSPYKTVDTLKVAKKYFKFNSNSLTDLGTYLGLGQKLETGGFKLWEDCMNGDRKAWAKMMKYNKQDVVLLEQVYQRMLPWMSTHPDTAKNGHCENCGSDQLQKRGFSVTRTSKKQRLHCQNCGVWRLGRAIRLTQEEKDE